MEFNVKISGEITVEAESIDDARNKAGSLLGALEEMADIELGTTIELNMKGKHRCANCASGCAPFESSQEDAPRRGFCLLFGRKLTDDELNDGVFCDYYIEVDP